MKEWKAHQNEWRVKLKNDLHDKNVRKKLKFIMPSNEQVARVKNLIYSLTYFCKQFFDIFPTKTIMPKFMTQSPLELLFSNYKMGGRGRELDESQLRFRLAAIRTTREIKENRRYNDFCG